MAWIACDRDGGLGLLAGRSNDLRCRSVGSMMILALVVMCLGNLCVGFRIALSQGFIRAARAPLYGAASSFLLDAVIGFLQRSSAEATAVLFSGSRRPGFFGRGFVFSLSNLTIHVAEECSGIRSFLSLFITSLVAGHFFLRSAWGKMGLVAVVVPLAIVKNAFRIVGLTLLANYVDPTFITNSVWHRRGGIPLFLLALVVLFSLVWLLRRSERKHGYYPPD